MFVLAHLSDPHLSGIPRPRLREVAGKRVIGLVNWGLRRRREHRAEVLAALVEDLAAAHPDHIAVTGDLVNVALPGEFATAREFLARLGPPDRVTFVPGNHDAYVRSAVAQSGRHWGDYMRRETAAESAPDLERFPFVRRRGAIALVGLSTAVPTGPLMATGRLGPAQVAALGEDLAALGQEGAFRVVLIHHPPVATAGDRMKRLLDAAAFRDAIARHGAELILHGHIHVHSLRWIDGPAGPVPIVGVPSASATERGHDRAAYNLYRIAQDGGGGGWRCEMVTRGFPPTGDAIEELDRRMLEPTGAAQISAQ